MSNSSEIFSYISSRLLDLLLFELLCTQADRLTNAHTQTDTKYLRLITRNF